MDPETRRIETEHGATLPVVTRRTPENDEWLAIYLRSQARPAPDLRITVPLMNDRIKN